MTFDEELKQLIDSGLPFDELAAAVAELHRRYGRQLPPPLLGTVALTEPDDGFGRQ